METNREKSFSLQAQLIREMQTQEGKEPCYATPMARNCDQEQCCWRHDCFHEVEEQEPTGNPLIG